MLWVLANNHNKCCEYEFRRWFTHVAVLLRLIRDDPVVDASMVKEIELPVWNHQLTYWQLSHAPLWALVNWLMASNKSWIYKKKIQHFPHVLGNSMRSPDNVKASLLRKKCDCRFYCQTHFIWLSWLYWIKKKHSNASSFKELFEKVYPGSTSS